MKALALFVIAAFTCSGSDISGVWRLKHAAADGPSVPIAVQLQQCGDHVQVLRIVSSFRGEQLEQLWLSAAAIHTRAKRIEITVGGETWIIGVRGELTIHEATGQHVVLEPAEGVVQ